jgi:hypothetical protein
LRRRSPPMVCVRSCASIGKVSCYWNMPMLSASGAASAFGGRLEAGQRRTWLRPHAAAVFETDPASIDLEMASDA